MEITVVSAEGLKNTAGKNPFSRRLRPFVIVTSAPPFAGDDQENLYTTEVDKTGGSNPTWNQKFILPVDSTFFYHRYSCLYLLLYTKGSIFGRTQLGWCRIPAADVLDGFSTEGSVRRLSFRLRAKDGSRGHGIVNVAVKLGPVGETRVVEGVESRTVIGVPVRMSAATKRCPSVSQKQLGFSCKEDKWPKEEQKWTMM